MIFTELRIPGAFQIELEPRGDARGFFARAFCQEEFASHGLNPTIAQANLSVSKERGTVRGMHFQRPPHGEAKTVRCTRGRIFDVLVDLRKDSPTYLGWLGVELSATNHRMLYIPEMCAHGFLTLEDDSEVVYNTSSSYAPAAEGGIRHDDPAVGIQWPAEIRVISDKDRDWPLL